MTNIPAGCQYNSKTIYVEAKTGEILRRDDAINIEKYIIIRTTKKIKYNANKTLGTIEYTRECIKQPQQEFNFDQTNKDWRNTIHTNRTGRKTLPSNGKSQNNRR